MSRGCARLGAAIARRLVVAVPVVGHSPDPIFSGGLYGQNAGAPVPLDVGRHAAAGHEARDPRRARRLERDPEVEGADVRLRRGCDQRRLLRHRTCRAGSTASPASDGTRRTDWFGIWFRPNGHRFDWGTLRWCEISGVAERLLRGRERDARRARARARAWTTTTTTRTTRTTATPSSRPTRGRSRRPSGTPTPTAAATSPTLQQQYDVAVLDDARTAPASTCRRG